MRVLSSAKSIALTPVSIAVRGGTRVSRYVKYVHSDVQCAIEEKARAKQAARLQETLAKLQPVETKG